MANTDISSISIPGIDTSAGIKQCGSPEMYIEFLGDVYRIIDKKSDETEKYLADGDISNFTTNVHALKTTCRMMGYTALSESFFELEKIGKEGSLTKAALLTPDVLARFRALKPYLEPFAEKETGDRIPFSAEPVISLLTEIEAASADFDIDRGETAIKKLLTYDCDKELADSISKLAEFVNDLDYDEASALASSIKKSL